MDRLVLITAPSTQSIGGAIGLDDPVVGDQRISDARPGAWLAGEPGHDLLECAGRSGDRQDRAHQIRSGRRAFDDMVVEHGESAAVQPSRCLGLRQVQFRGHDANRDQRLLTRVRIEDVFDEVGDLRGGAADDPSVHAGKVVRSGDEQVSHGDPERGYRGGEEWQGLGHPGRVRHRIGQCHRLGEKPAQVHRILHGVRQLQPQSSVELVHPLARQPEFLGQVGLGAGLGREYALVEDHPIAIIDGLDELEQMRICQYPAAAPVVLTVRCPGCLGHQGCDDVDDGGTADPRQAQQVAGRVCKDIRNVSNTVVVQRCDGMRLQLERGHGGASGNSREVVGKCDVRAVGHMPQRNEFAEATEVVGVQCLCWAPVQPGVGDQLVAGEDRWPRPVLLEPRQEHGPSRLRERPRRGRVGHQQWAFRGLRSRHEVAGRDGR